MAQLVANKTSLAVYIGRPGRGEDGYFGNQCAVGRDCARCKRFHANNADAIEAFAGYFAERVVNDREFAMRVRALKGRDLWCPGRCTANGRHCHGDVIVAWIASNT